MERKIGEVFNYNGRMLEVCKSNEDCTGCFFNYGDLSECPNNNKPLRNYTGPCCFRSDDKRVKFKEIVSTTQEETTAPKKNDRKDHKLRWELLPMAEIEDLIKVYTFGALKYAPNSWQGLPDGAERYRAALFRHLCEFCKGNALDEETHLPHLAHLVWNAVAMLHFWKKENPELAKRSDEEFKKLIKSIDIKEDKE